MPGGTPPRGAIARVTVANMARVRPTPSCVLVLSLDPSLTAQATSEIAGRCPVLSIGAPADLARVASRSGDRIVVLIDTARPSIELPTFVGLVPILPPTTRVVLWGTDARQHGRLASMFPQASTWIASNASQTPGTFVLDLGV